MIPKSIIVESGSVCTHISKEDALYKVEYIKKSGEKCTIFAKNLVGSDGANSQVRKLVTKKTPKKYIAIQEWFASSNENAFYTCIFDKSITPNYAYTITKDNYFLVCGILNIKNSAENFEKLKSAVAHCQYTNCNSKNSGEPTHNVKKRDCELPTEYSSNISQTSCNIKNELDLSNPIKREACLVFKPSKLSDFCTGKDGIFLIGESAGFISPSSFEGISYAIESAIILSKILNAPTKNTNKSYSRKTLPLRLKLIKKHLKAKIIFSPTLRKLIMSSNIKTIKSEH